MGVVDRGWAATAAKTNEANCTDGEGGFVGRSTMSTPIEPITVRHNADESRYETTVDGRQAVCDYTMDRGRVVFTHTFVPPELRGRGIAEKLVRTALDDARQRHLQVVAACSYVAAYIERHPEYQNLIA